MRSLPPERAAQEAGELAAKGYRELVLTGIEIASYGEDLPGGPNLADAVVAIAEAAPELRLRLGSLEPTVATEDFCPPASPRPGPGLRPTSTSRCSPARRHARAGCAASTTRRPSSP